MPADTELQWGPFTAIVKYVQQSKYWTGSLVNELGFFAPGTGTVTANTKKAVLRKLAQYALAQCDMLEERSRRLQERLAALEDALPAIRKHL